MVRAAPGVGARHDRLAAAGLGSGLQLYKWCHLEHMLGRSHWRPRVVKGNTGDCKGPTGAGQGRRRELYLWCHRHGGGPIARRVPERRRLQRLVASLVGALDEQQHHASSTKLKLNCSSNSLLVSLLSTNESSGA